MASFPCRDPHRGRSDGDRPSARIVFATVAKRYNPDQPRNPAGSGREAGRWTSSSSTSSFHEGVSDTVSSAAVIVPAQPKFALLIPPPPGLLQELAPSAIGWLARMAARLAGPLAFFGAIVIPDRNPGITSEGTIPGKPDIAYRINHDDGTLRLTDKRDPDPDHVTVALLGHDGLYREVDTGLAIARSLPGGGVVIDATSEAEEQPDTGRKPRAAADEPKLCPAPTDDKAGGRRLFDELYRQYVRDAVNPQRIPQLDPKLTFALPLGDKTVNYDDCQESTGRMIEAKGHYADALTKPFMRKVLRKDWIEQGENEVDAARGRGVDWYFHEATSAAFAFSFFNGEKLSRIKIHVLPFPGGVPKPNPRIR